MNFFVDSKKMQEMHFTVHLCEKAPIRVVPELNTRRGQATLIFQPKYKCAIDPTIRIEKIQLPTQ